MSQLIALMIHSIMMSIIIAGIYITLDAKQVEKIKYESVYTNLYLDIQKVSFYLKNIKELRVKENLKSNVIELLDSGKIPEDIKNLREEEEKLIHNTIKLLSKYKSLIDEIKSEKIGKNIKEGKRIETKKHFVDYSTQEINREGKNITYNVLVDDQLCNDLIEKTEEKDDLCTKKENGSVYTYVLYNDPQ